MLGPVEVIKDGRQIPLGAARLRCVLGLLALEAGRVVPTAWVAEALWGERPPRGQANSIQVTVSKLRQVVAGEAVITRRGQGYLLDVDPGAVDLHRFRSAVTRAGTLGAGQDVRAESILADALRLWRGAPLADVDSDLIRHRLVPSLEQEWLSARLDHAEVTLRLGGHAKALPELTALARQHPHQQRLAAQLMLALYRDGRPDDALSVYRRLRANLGQHSGLEPSRELRKLHQDILRADPALDPPTAETARVTLRAVKPAQLPLAVAEFTGRDAEVARLLGHARAGSISALAGQGGVGKTSLALQVAHELAAEYPDGQLYVNLGGARPGPLEPSRALVGLLSALGVPSGHLPDRLEERSALFRSLLAGRRLVILLDDAASEAQVRPLLPGTRSVVVLVTSRTSLLGLEGTHHLRLDVLTRAQAVGLLAKVAGATRIGDEPEAAAELAGLCGHLPLAVRVAAARLVARPRLSVSQLVRRLSDERRRLDELVAGDLAVRASLRLSYQALAPRLRHAFRTFALLGVPDFASWAGAAMLGVSAVEAEELLEALVDVHLIEVSYVDTTGRARYRFHDLTRLFARECAFAEDDESDRAESLRRAVGCWLALADEANRRLPHPVLDLIDGTAPRPALTDGCTRELLADPIAWFDAERASLLVLVEVACPAPAWEAAQVSAGYLAIRNLRDEWAETNTSALRASIASGDWLGEAVTLRGLALHSLPVDHLAAHEHAAAAHQLFAGLGDRRGRADAQPVRGAALRLAERSDEAMECLREAVKAARGEAWVSTVSALILMALLHRDAGRLDEVAPCLHRARGLARRLRDEPSEAFAWLLEGSVLSTQDKTDAAVAAFERALALFRSLGHRATQAMTLVYLACGYTRQGDARAPSLLDEALRLAKDRGPEPTGSMAVGALVRFVFPSAEFERALAVLVATVRRDRPASVGLVPELFRELGDSYQVMGEPTKADDAWERSRHLLATRS
ncbi:BTAD domain-containing putative transcriptional regulator [Amycolatopsis sp. WAC 01376]|uniref:AfsR/SARP family transcriptional regulator n=1 Tax=Amycolatopsis sp. WAC 01376 TaxID=2203195 RepID=UPI0013156695|nr:BTAD domain-containing putative transcriptional regulator [Amycolatopsis sp. WAC 01376]